MSVLKSKTITISIERDPQAVYDFVSNPANLPKWAKMFCQSIEVIGQDWVATTPQGPVKIGFAPRNEWGILDHSVSPSPEVEILVPMRVVENGEGSEVIFTLFRQPGMSDLSLKNDAAWVERDLAELKRVLEK